MARYNLFKGKSRGSIGDVTFTTQNGVQISRVRNRHPRNPRTNPQMLQRAIWATIVRAYSAGKSFYSTAFESATTPRQNMTAFMSVNMDYLRQLIIDELDNQTPVDQQRGRVVHPQSYTPTPIDGLTISQGTLTDTIFTVTPATDETPLTVSMPAPASATETIADYAQRIGLTSDTIYTIVANIVDTQISILYPQPLTTPYAINYQSYFGTTQLTLKTTLPTIAITSATMADIFDIQYTGNVLPYSFAAIEFRNGTWTANTLLRKIEPIGTLGISAYKSSTKQTTKSTMQWISTYNAYGIATEYLITIWGKEKQEKEDTFIPQEPLPYDYEIEYLEVNSQNWNQNPWINTKFVPTPKTIIYAKFMCYDGYSESCSLIGTRFQNSDNGRILVVSPQKINRTGAMGNINFGPKIYNDKKIHFIQYNLFEKKVIIDNENTNLNNATIVYDTYNTLSLFKINGYEIDYRGNGRIYYLTIIDEDKTIMELIPVVKDNIGYMYDKINKTLLKSENENSFILGPQI